MDPVVIRAIKDSLTLDQLLTLRDKLTADLLSGLTITSVSLSTSSFTSQVNLPPQDTLAIIQPIIEQLSGTPVTDPPMGTAVNGALKLIQT